MNRLALAVTLFVLSLAISPLATAQLRPPSTPLIVHDPYFSVWSATDNLTDSETKHWTGASQPMAGLARVDGSVYRFMGNAPSSVPAMQQVSKVLTPTRTIYEFEKSGIQLTLTFFTPALAADLAILSRPVTYISWDVRSIDSGTHTVSVYLDCSSLMAVNTAYESVVWSRAKVGTTEVLSVGSSEQKVLGVSGDDLRINWGRFYLAAPDTANERLAAANGREARNKFFTSGGLPDADLLDMPATPRTGAPVLAAAIDFGNVGAPNVSRHVLVAYDDLFSIEYLNRKLRPYWRKDGANFADLLRKAVSEYESLLQRAITFDNELTADLTAAGGREYTELSVLAYRQAIGAHKLVADTDGTPLFFAKENFSNGCIDTVDVFYPSAPLFLLLNPKLVEGQMKPILDYASLPRWRWPFAPHDLGTYPLANGQVYGGGERTEEDQMPVEETGNMLILALAVARAEGNANLARSYWPLLTKWADYLRAKGLDPDNQLSTDDFAGHLAHNSNLSIKAIEAVASYAELAKLLGDSARATDYRNSAKQMAEQWEHMAADGDHYRLAFDKTGTWSQKYNLVWDKVLGLNLFDKSIVRREMAFYLLHQNEFGLPLDNRRTYTKLDWIVWTATLADSVKDFQSLIAPLHKYADQTPSRVPLSDWYDTIDAKQQGFQARSVVGGVFIKMLADPNRWRKWSSQANSASATGSAGN
jgi:glutaminase A-like protein/uncharacterized protein DUF5127/uncharacterized protein DUF4964